MSSTSTRRSRLWERHYATTCSISHAIRKKRLNSVQKRRRWRRLLFSWTEQNIYQMTWISKKYVVLQKILLWARTMHIILGVGLRRLVVEIPTGKVLFAARVDPRGATPVRIVFEAARHHRSAPGVGEGLFETGPTERRDRTVPGCNRKIHRWHDAVARLGARIRRHQFCVAGGDDLQRLEDMNDYRS